MSSIKIDIIDICREFSKPSSLKLAGLEAREGKPEV